MCLPNLIIISNGLKLAIYQFIHTATDANINPHKYIKPRVTEPNIRSIIYILAPNFFSRKYNKYLLKAKKNSCRVSIAFYGLNLIIISNYTPQILKPMNFRCTINNLNLCVKKGVHYSYYIVEIHVQNLMENSAVNTLFRIKEAKRN